MNNIASKSWTPAAVVVTTLACLAMFALVPAPAAEAQQANAAEEEIAARVRAELEARMAQVNQRLLERMQSLEALRNTEMGELQREFEALQIDESGMRQALERYAQLATELQGRSTEETRRRTGELTRRAMEQAQVALRRAGRVSTLSMRGGCEAFGDTVLDVSEELELSDDQVDRIRGAQRSTRRDRIERNADIEVGEMDLEALYEGDEPDVAAIRAKLEELALLGVDNQIAGLTLRQQVNQILTPAQRQQLEDLRSDDDVHIIITGVGSGWSMGRSGC